ncbi:MAG: Uma2 family endonuclease [Leptolyngbyaceae cyanobacterium bins.302]|nr:Uma2 family endonuclease [Leptolyngbyaceae cyanobacterium bins.302]
MTSVTTAQIATPLTFEEFLAWDDGSDRNFELIDGVPVPLTEPTADHEDVADNLCDLLKQHCADANLPYVPKRLKQVRLRTVPGEKEKSRKPDIVVFDKTVWESMKGLSSPAAAYVPPPLVIEVVSTNWQDDYLIKLAEFETLGIPEYWIVDFAAFGGRRYIGDPKQPTVSVYQLSEGEYQMRQFRGNDLVDSAIFPNLQLPASAAMGLKL